MFRLSVRLLLGTCALPAFADLPMSVDDVVTRRGKFKSEVSLAYANADRHAVSLGEALVVQTGPTSFITLPTAVGDGSVNSDTVVSTSAR